jgi:dihydropteroate synthase-like protein
LPDTAFPHLEDAVRALKAEGMAVSVDSGDPGELKRGAAAGADYILSLDEHSLGLAHEMAAVPILVPARHGDLDSLMRACKQTEEWGLPYIADPVLDPIHFGFMDSLARYAEFRQRKPEAEILMGTGNLTELTGADTVGITAILMGIASELRIRNALVVQVSPHTRRTVEEHDAARRIMYAARRDGSLPKGYGDALLCLHDMRPFGSSPEDIAAIAASVRDTNFRIETAADGIHVYNRDLHRVATEAMALFPDLGVERDGAHAFYLGSELMKAEIAWRLGKRYAQDEPLNWGSAADPPKEDDETRLKAPGHTLAARRSKS